MSKTEPHSLAAMHGISLLDLKEKILREPQKNAHIHSLKQAASGLPALQGGSAEHAWSEYKSVYTASHSATERFIYLTQPC